MSEYKYLVVGCMGDEEFSRIMTAQEIFRMMGHEDDYPEGISIELYRINGYGEALTDCSFVGKWHDHKDPLKMAIVGGGIREVGYAEEH